MVKLVPAVCPQCGAELSFPENLNHAFCTYCGRKILISNEMHYHISQGDLENYYELGRRSFQAHDYQDAVDYLEKALEIDVKSKKVNDLITQAYYGLAFRFVAFAAEKRALAKKEKSLSYGSGGVYLGDDDNRRLHNHLDDLEDEIDHIHLQRSNQYSHEAKRFEEKAKIYFMKAGVCPDCQGKKYCPYCNGSGYCTECDGTGTEYLIMTCSECAGYKLCIHCRGWRTCPHCRGTGVYGK